MNKTFSIGIRVNSVVKKYIVTNYGDQIRISLKNPVSMVLYSFLQKKDILKFKTKGIDRAIPTLTDQIFLIVRKSDIYSHGICIDESCHHIINNYFEDEIYAGIFMRIKSYRKAKIPIRLAVEDFCAENNIELDNDITLESILKAEYRYRNAKTKLFVEAGTTPSQNILNNLYES